MEEQLSLFEWMGSKINRRSFVINEEGRECKDCQEFKLWDTFKKCGSGGTNGRRAICEECFETRNKEKLEKFNNLERTLTAGHVGADGMVFYGYSMNCKDFEHWVTPEKFTEYREQTLKLTHERAAEFEKVDKSAFKRGDVREDGMIFYCWEAKYRKTDFQLWLTPEQFEMENLNATIGNYIRSSLAEFDAKKEGPKHELIGLSMPDLRKHLSTLFTEGMSFNNRGVKGWHVDHKLPLSAAENAEETKKLWHFTNLQPMWSTENYQKNNKHCKVELKAFFEEREAAEQ